MALLEQTFRPGFVTEPGQNMGGGGPRRLKGRSARIIVTMGMPAFFYRLYYRSHSVKSFRRNILRFCGFKPVRSTLIGVTVGGEKARAEWLDRMKVLGRSAR